MINKYPYTDIHELNLDWLLAKMKELQINFDEFKVVNQISFSGAWDITKNYPAWTIVSDNNIGYVSIQPVPAGVLLTNGDYWREVIDYSAQIAGLQSRVVAIEDDIDDNIKPDITALQGDITNLQSQIDTWTTFKKIFKNKKVVIIGDSISIPSTTWAEPFKTLVESIGGTVDNRAVGGYRADQCDAVVATLTEAYDIAIVWCGLNDVAHHGVPADYTPLGGVGTPGTFNYYYNDIINNLKTLNGDMIIYTFGLSYARNGAYYINSSEYYYTYAIQTIAESNGCIFKDMSQLPNNSLNYYSFMEADKVHFTEAISKTVVFDAIVNKLSSTIGERFSKTFYINSSDFTAGADVTLGTVYGAHTIGGAYECTGLIIVNNNIAAGNTVLSMKFEYIPNQVWVQFCGAENKSGIGVINSQNVQTYKQLDAGTYTFHINFMPNYVNSLSDEYYP